MVRTSLALLAVLTLTPSPAVAACGLHDPGGDTALADDHVMDGAYEAPGAAPSLDVIRARVAPSGRDYVFTVQVVNLATATAEAPAGAVYSWTAEYAKRMVYVFAWRNAAGQSGVELHAGRDAHSLAHVGSYAGAVYDDTTDTVTFRVPAAALAAHGLRPGTRVTNIVETTRGVAVAAPDGPRKQSLRTDSVSDIPANGWARC